ncbi:hypothetical protein LINPERHAP1_LOCUS10608 [Linum perenne]
MGMSITKLQSPFLLRHRDHYPELGVGNSRRAWDADSGVKIDFIFGPCQVSLSGQDCVVESIYGSIAAHYRDSANEETGLCNC